MNDRVLLCVTLLFALTGCALPSGALTNRVVCTVAGDEAHIVSMWGLFGIARKADKRDAAVILRAGCNSPKIPNGSPS